MNRFGRFSLALLGVTAITGYTIAFTTLAKAHETHHYPQLAGWAEEQVLTREAGQRFACHVFEKTNASCFCCHGSEIVKTKFRLVQGTGPYPEDAYEWLDPRTGNWARVPDDTIHWDEPTPTKEAVIFVLGGKVRCFFPGETGG